MALSRMPLNQTLQSDREGDIESNYRHIGMTHLIRNVMKPLTQSLNSSSTNIESDRDSDV